MTDFTLTQLLPHWRPAQLEQLADELRYCYRPTLTDEELTTMLTRQLQQHQRRYLQFNRHYQQMARHYQQTQEHYPGPGHLDRQRPGNTTRTHQDR